MARANKATGAKDDKSGKAKKSQTKKSQPATRGGSKAKSSATPAKGKGTKRAGASATASTKSSKKRAPAKKKAVNKPTKSTSGTAKKSQAGPAKKAQAKKKSPFPAKFLKEMEALLHTERDTYERQAAQLRAEAQSLVEDLDPGDVQFDEESGEGDTIAVERNRDLALASKAQEMIGEIDHALSKFELGTYGICEVSGEPIPNERLEAIPWAREKVEYKVGGFGRR